MYVHGGSWALGHGQAGFEERRAGCERWSLELGVAVVDIDWRPAPAVTYPAQTLDVAQALSWSAHWLPSGGTIRVNRATRLAMLAVSSGANVAMGALIGARLERWGLSTPTSLDAVVLLVPSLDVRTTIHVRGLDAATKAAALETRDRYFVPPDGSRPDFADPTISPATADSLVGLPPIWMGLAAHDPLARPALTFARSAAARGDPVSADVFEMIHTEATPDVIDAIPRRACSFLGDHWGPRG